MTISHSPAPARSDVAAATPGTATSPTRPFLLHGRVLSAGALAWSASILTVGAVALGEIDMPADSDVLRDRSLYSSVASCSSGVELDRAQVVVVGNATGVGGRYRIGHSVMEDALDADGIWDAIRSAGLDLPERPRTSDLDGRLVNVFLKCEASQDGHVRGRRNAMPSIRLTSSTGIRRRRARSDRPDLPVDPSAV